MFGGFATLPVVFRRVPLRRPLPVQMLRQMPPPIMIQKTVSTAMETASMRRNQWHHADAYRRASKIDKHYTSSPVVIRTMLFITALFSVLVTFAVTTAAPAVEHHRLNLYLDETSIYNTTNGVSRAYNYGDRLIHVDAYPGYGCTGKPSTLDFSGDEGAQECWNYKNAVSLKVVASYVRFFNLLYFITSDRSPFPI
ncbi:MAG: hypothetical protein Q9212_002446 [Teloschistes hypoglaucus]